MSDPRRNGWVLACALGFGTLFVAFALGGLLVSFFRPSHWPDVPSPSLLDPMTGAGGVRPEILAEMYRANVLYHVIHVTLFGGVIGWLQTRALRTPEIRRLPWVTLTALGFASIFVFEAFRPGIVSGGHPGPMEPLMIGVIGGSVAGLLQWLYLRNRGIGATRWLTRWIAGLCAGAALAAVLLTLLGFLGPFVRSVLSESEVYTVGQLVFYVIYGPTVGGVAGLVSGGALMEALSTPSDPVSATTATRT